MLKTFNDFLSARHRYRNLCNNVEMEHIYTSILSNEQNIIKMINVINNDVTPVAVCAKEIEEYLSTLTNSSVTIDRSVDEAKADNYRQAVGTMIAFILNPFGYEKIKGKNRPIPSSYKGNHLFSGATYSKTGPATMQLVQKIAPIEL